MRGITAWCTSPKVAHFELLEYIYRWNRRMDIDNRDLNLAVGRFFDQPVVEATKVILLRIAMRCSCKSFTVYK